ncbi:hypothetical protein [Psychrobacter sp. FDAARGOS_221]|uniref:hypothetical protein n=1 Tax=Psychrobacter sp. FDAARGOS_221 TaxID=1975705 RepID=UPI000BB59982|nr:hypothetical protein [Psychrobacter sp. FDAARGOS_221]PNK61206.1 hypothetical protein A6J60_010205 [Psychrobacter sp. FDAARGOS_221]
MHIPKYWAQHTQRFEQSNQSAHTRPMSITRYGWSANSKSDAITHAKQRVVQAHTQKLEQSPSTRLVAWQVWLCVIAAMLLVVIIALFSLSWLWLILFLGVAKAVLWWQDRDNAY